MTEPTDNALTVNGARAPHVPDLLALLARHDVDADTRGVAVAVNGAIVPRDQWRSRQLVPGDVIDIVGAVQGG